MILNGNKKNPSLGSYDPKLGIYQKYVYNSNNI